jgi:hypothetical protein
VSKTVTCPNCGFQVVVTSDNGNTRAQIEMSAYLAICRRAKDLPPLEANCPELQRVTGIRIENRPENPNAS